MTKKKRRRIEALKNAPETWSDGCSVHRSHVSATRYRKRRRLDEIIAARFERECRRLGFAKPRPKEITG